MLVAGALNIEKAAKPSIPIVFLDGATEGAMFGTKAWKVMVDRNLPDLNICCSSTKVVA